MQKLFKMTQVSGNTVGQRAFKRIPDEFVRIEFWRISGEPITVQPGMLMDKLPDRCPFMRGTAVPEVSDAGASFEEIIHSVNG